EDLVSLGHLAPHVTGVYEVARLVEPSTPEAVAPVVGIDPDVIVRLTRGVAAAASAALYGRLGTHTVALGTLASRAADDLNVLTGNLDRPGGAMFARPAHASAAAKGRGRGFTVGRHRSRVKGYPEVRGELPVATLADEIETPGPGQVR